MKARFENGVVRLNEPAPVSEPTDVEVIFLDRDDRRWEEIIGDSVERPALHSHVAKVMADHRAGLTKPLNINEL